MIHLSVLRSEEENGKEEDRGEVLIFLVISILSKHNG